MEIIFSQVSYLKEKKLLLTEQLVTCKVCLKERCQWLLMLGWVVQMEWDCQEPHLLYCWNSQSSLMTSLAWLMKLTWSGRMLRTKMTRMFRWKKLLKLFLTTSRSLRDGRMLQRWDNGLMKRRRIWLKRSRRMLRLSIKRKRKKIKRRKKRKRLKKMPISKKKRKKKKLRKK